MRRPTMLIVLATIVGMLLAACGSKTPSANGSGITQASTLTGAGSTFAAPLYDDWGSLYQASSHVNVSYNSVGSSAGITDITAKTVDFGASDAAYTPTETAAQTILNIPTAISAVVITYNLSALAKGTTLNFSPQTLVDIFSGKVTNWNSPEIAADNPGVKLPTLAITVVHRSDGSGTTNIFTSYLATVSASWKATYGPGSTTINWPNGELGGKGSSGVEADVASTDGAIGYVELTYAVQNNTPSAGIKNAAGDFVTPTVSSAQAATSQFDASTIPAGDNIVFTLLNEPGATSYPICGPTYILAYQQQTNGPAGLALVNFLTWGLSVGQAGEAALSYVKLPAPIVTRALQAVDSITYNSTPLASPTS